MEIQEKIIEILKKDFVCNNCLGRNFANLLTGMDNEQRGIILRQYLAMLVDSEEKIKVEESNFYGIKFHNVKIKSKKPEKCSICDNIFKELKKKAKIIAEKLEKYEFDTLLIGCIPLPKLLENEEDLWSEIGVEWCEPIRAEINRELGKKVLELTKKDMDRKNPDITILYDFSNKKVGLNVRSIFVYGKYQKLVRGIPQTTWKTRIYPISVQDVIGKPFEKQTRCENVKFHGSGREDVDVRCLGWRPFIIEFVNPLKRTLDLKKALKAINKSKKTKVKDLKISNKRNVKKLKAEKYDKTYRAEVEFENIIENIEKIEILKDSVISQKTPNRVLKRRVDKIRKRRVKNIEYKILSKKKVRLDIMTQAGLYIKELISGDDERTQPNISKIINNKVKSIKLDVIKVHSD